jgi:hypothetical protein
LQRRCGHRDKFRERARPRHAHDRHAGRKSRNIGRRRVDDAGEFRSGREGERILGLIQPLYFQAVDEADACGLDLDPHMAGCDLGQGNLLQPDILDGIVLLDHDGLHFSSCSVHRHKWRMICPLTPSQFKP